MTLFSSVKEVFSNVQLVGTTSEVGSDGRGFVPQVRRKILGGEEEKKKEQKFK